MIEPLTRLWPEVTGEPLDPDAVRIDGDETALPGPFRVTLAASTCVAATTLAVARLLADRGGTPGRVGVNARHAAEAFRSERRLRVNGKETRSLWLSVSGDYRASDGWVKLHCNYPHHEAAACVALGVRADRDAVAAAVARLSAVDVEEAVIASGGAAAALRDRDSWLNHPQGSAVRAEPLVAIERIGDAPPEPLAPATRPLAGVRVLDLTHVIAGPVCGRTLAAHGADVLHVGAAHLPSLRTLVIDTGFGKRSCHVDLREPAGRDTLRALVGRADVLVNSYRPDSLAAKGFGPAELARSRPGIVLVSLSAYGHSGPWRTRRGFDSLVQMSSGIANAGTAEPRPLPAQALDHGTGWLAALGVLAALRRRAREGGSWHVRLSLARTAWWLDGLGRMDATRDGTESNFMSEIDSPFGTLNYVRIPGELPGAEPHWSHGPRLPGGDAPEWPV